MRSMAMFVLLAAGCGHPATSRGGGGGGYVQVDPIVGTWRGGFTGIADADAQGNVVLHLADDAPSCAQSAPDAVSECSRGSWQRTGPTTYSFTVRDFDVVACTCGDTLTYPGEMVGNDTVNVGDEDVGDTFTRM